MQRILRICRNWGKPRRNSIPPLGLNPEVHVQSGSSVLKVRSTQPQKDQYRDRQLQLHKFQKDGLPVAGPVG